MQYRGFDIRNVAVGSRASSTQVRHLITQDEIYSGKRIRLADAQRLIDKRYENARLRLVELLDPKGGK